MESTKFDDLTKALATPSSRRQALQRIGGVLAGAILASWPFSRALADNSACAHFCNTVFAPGPARGQCISDAALGTGLCYTCGPASPGGTKPICCPENASGQCTSYSSATCCTSSQTCQNGTCCTANGDTCSGNGDCCSDNCASGVCCPSGYVKLCNGTCAKPCSSNADCPCGSCAEDVFANASFCTTGQQEPLTFGSGNCFCPTGQFFSNIGALGFCLIAC